MDIELRHLRLVFFVAREQSLTKAAPYLHLTQPALSHQLRDLEERLGTPLFHRLGKRMRPTSAGRRLLQVTPQVLGLVEHAEEEVRRMAAGQTGTVRLSTECYTCYHWLPAVIDAYRADYPEVAVEINTEVTDRPLPALLAGTIDLAVVSNPVDDARLAYHPLFADDKVALLRPDHPLAARPYLDPEDFADEHLILYSGSHDHFLNRILRPAGVQPKRITRVQVTEGIVELVKAGLGITVLARWAAAPEVAAGALRAVPVTQAGYRRRWSAAVLNGSTPPPYLSAFVALLAERMKGFNPDAAGGDGHGKRRDDGRLSLAGGP